MWDRHLSLSPAEARLGVELSERSLLPAVHAFFEGTGEVLAPAFDRCEPVRLSQLPQKLNGSEGMACGVIFRVADHPSSLCGVIFSEDLCRPIIERYQTWPERVEDAGQIALHLVEGLADALGFKQLEAPVLVFDMHAAVLETVATMASPGRNHCVLQHAFLRGVGLRKWAHRFAVFDKDVLTEMLSCDKHELEAA